MKYCPNVECEHLIRNGIAAEFLDKADRCSDCRGELSEGEAPRPEPPVYRELVTVYEADRGDQAHLIKAVLANEGIPVHVSGESLLGAMGELPLTMQPVRVQVPPEFAKRARELALECDEDSDTSEQDE